MVQLKSFSPDHLVEDAKRSGFFHCKSAGYFGLASRIPRYVHKDRMGVPFTLCFFAESAIPLSLSNA